MKLIKILFLVILFNGASNIHADIGTHNFQINVGGGYLSSSVYDQLVSSDLGFYVDVPGYEFNGSIFRTEIAYLLHGVRPSGLVNGLDIRANFTMSWRKGLVLQNPTGEITQAGQSLGGGFQIAYTLGVQFKSGSRLMFDILGFGASMNKHDITRTINYADDRDSKTRDLGISTSVSSEYILPGIHYISKGGLTIGVRNFIRMPLYGAYSHDNSHGSYEVMPYAEFITGAYIGFTFGK